MASTKLTVARLENAGWAGWLWVTFTSGARKSVTVRELQARTTSGEWVLPAGITVEPFVT